MRRTSEKSNHDHTQQLRTRTGTRGVVVNFDLQERFPRPRSQQRGSLRHRARRVAVLGVGARGGRLLPLRGSGGITFGKKNLGDF